MIWRSFLSLFGIAAPQTIDLIAQLDERLKHHADEARQVERSAEVRAMMARTDPSREEMRDLNKKRDDAISAAFQRRRDK